MWTAGEARWPFRIDLFAGTCTCPDRRAPTVRDTKLCEHVLACLVLKQLAERVDELLSFRPIRHGPPRHPGVVCFSYEDATVGPRRGSPPCPADTSGRAGWSAGDPLQPSSRACDHRRYIATSEGTWCLACDARLADDPAYDVADPGA